MLVKPVVGTRLIAESEHKHRRAKEPCERKTSSGRPTIRSEYST
jgi:hypothetical protein